MLMPQTVRLIRTVDGSVKSLQLQFPGCKAILYSFTAVLVQSVHLNRDSIFLQILQYLAILRLVF